MDLNQSTKDPPHAQRNEEREVRKESQATEASDASWRRPNVYERSTARSAAGTALALANEEQSLRDSLWCPLPTENKNAPRKATWTEWLRGHPEAWRARNGDCNSQGSTKHSVHGRPKSVVQRPQGTAKYSSRKVRPKTQESVLVNIYIHPGNWWVGTSCVEYNNYELGDTVVMCGDINARSKMRDQQGNNPLGKALEEALGDGIFNPVTTPLPTRLGSRHSLSTIDLALVFLFTGESGFFLCLFLSWSSLVFMTDRYITLICIVVCKTIGSSSPCQHFSVFFKGDVLASGVHITELAHNSPEFLPILFKVQRSCLIPPAFAPVLDFCLEKFGFCFL